MQNECHKLEEVARGYDLHFAFVFARPVNTSLDVSAMFYLVAEDGSFLYEPKKISSTADGVLEFIARKRSDKEYLESERRLPYYGG